MSATAGLGGRRISFTVALALFISLFAVSAASAARPDFDGDGPQTTPGKIDCAPLDPAVHPGAVDKPDLSFEDTNCDGIDGDKAKAIFVDPTLAPNNNGTGSFSSPKGTLGGPLGAIATAKAAGKDVYMMVGTYNETANLEDNVGLYGGYDPDTGQRSNSNVSTIKGVGGPAAIASGDTGAVLQLLTLEGAPDGSGNAYGLRAVNGGPGTGADTGPSRLVLEKVDSKATAASGNASGGDGFGGLFPGGPGGGSGGDRGRGGGVRRRLGWGLRRERRVWWWHRRGCGPWRPWPGWLRRHYRWRWKRRHAGHQRQRRFGHCDHP